MRSSRASRWAFSRAATASPGRENVGFVAGLVERGGGGGVGNETDTGRAARRAVR